MEDMVAFQFLKYMDDEALTRYEVFLGIMKDANKTLEERKAYINALLIGSGKLSADKIKAIVRQFVDCECDIELSGAKLVPYREQFKLAPQQKASIKSSGAIQVCNAAIAIQIKIHPVEHPFHRHGVCKLDHYVKPF